MIILIDKGHGGFIDGVYQTAPKKMYEFESGEVAYEGRLNRQIGDKLLARLKAEGIKCIDICPTEMDIPLSTRVNIINEYCNKYGASNCLLISLHGNAGKGTGFEIWTSPGQTKSDEYATQFFNKFKEHFPDVKLRKDISDGDPDKESAFYILKNTNCPAILPEFLFFDNWQDFLLMKDHTFQYRYAEMMVDFVKEIVT